MLGTAKRSGSIDHSASPKHATKRLRAVSEKSEFCAGGLVRLKADFQRSASCMQEDWFFQDPCVGTLAKTTFDEAEVVVPVKEKSFCLVKFTVQSMTLQTELAFTWAWMI